ncbi:TIGR02450 family Trp-rich protein [uncultured Gilvimarinus sp.]|uniref:TIGR02450 family Trp-rich protein n=1 Tax=uncultured Gilvimarinus sp. TaxID=1689143 RepID=UPI0030EB2355
MNKINPKKLLNSKWTAVTPVDKEKHFIVTEVEFDEDDEVILCVLEAVFTKRANPIDWNDLKDDSRWAFGWK